MNTFLGKPPESVINWIKEHSKPSDPTKYGDKITSGGKWTRSDGLIYTSEYPYDPTHQNPITWRANDSGISVIDLYDKAFCDAQGIPDSMKRFFTMNSDNHDYTNSTENYEKIIEFVDSAGRRYVWSETET